MNTNKIIFVKYWRNQLKIEIELNLVQVIMNHENEIKPMLTFMH